MAEGNDIRRVETLEELGALLGYSGSIQGTPLDDALDEQRGSLWQAAAIVEMVCGSMSEHFGDWPNDGPDFKNALVVAKRIIDDATSGLEGGVLEDRGLAIARERRDAEVAERAASGDAESVAAGGVMRRSPFAMAK